MLHEDLTYKIRGAAFNVYNTLGFGHKEQVYQKSLIREFRDFQIAFEQEQSLPVKYKGEKVGLYRPDFIVEGKIIIEIKAVDFLPKTFETQLLQYLKSTGFELGLLINFGSPTLYIKRIIWTN